MRTLVGDICWTISPNRNIYSIRTKLLRFYNTPVGYFYSTQTTPLYDGENVILKSCEIVRNAFRAVNKDRELAPYALCPNDYDGCPFCNKYYRDEEWSPTKCPFSLKSKEVWISSKKSLIGFYKLYHGKNKTYGYRRYYEYLGSNGIYWENKKVLRQMRWKYIKYS